MTALLDEVDQELEARRRASEVASQVLEVFQLCRSHILNNKM